MSIKVVSLKKLVRFLKKLEKVMATCGYGYLEQITYIFQTNGWTVSMHNNHSKVMLFDTDAGKFVIESSSNLNENPKVEQFRLEKSAELFDFYNSFFSTLKNSLKRIV